MKLEMNRAWSQAMALIGANKDVVFVVAGVFFFLPYLIFMMAMPNLGATMTDPADVDAAMAQMGAFYADFWWAVIVIAVFQGIGMLGLIALLTDQRRPTVGEALKIGVVKVLPYLAAYLILGLAIGLLAVVLIGAAGATGSVGAALLGGLVTLVLVAYAFVKFSLVPPVMVKDGIANPFTALAQSWRLTKGNSFRLFLFYFLLLLAVFVVMMVLSIVLGLLFALAGPEAQLFGNAFLTSLMNAIWATVFLAVLAAVHDQLGGTSSVEISETFE
jgi:hypothetical protein